MRARRTPSSNSTMLPSSPAAAGRWGGKDRTRRSCRSPSPRPARKLKQVVPVPSVAGEPDASKHNTAPISPAQSDDQALEPGARHRAAGGLTGIIIDDFDILEAPVASNIDEFVLAASGPAPGRIGERRPPLYVSAPRREDIRCGHRRSLPSRRCLRPISRRDSRVIAASRSGASSLEQQERGMSR
jgi:hypothetical protein